MDRNNGGRCKPGSKMSAAVELVWDAEPRAGAPGRRRRAVAASLKKLEICCCCFCLCAAVLLLRWKDQSSALIKGLFRSCACLQKFKVSFDHLTAWQRSKCCWETSSRVPAAAPRGRRNNKRVVKSQFTRPPLVSPLMHAGACDGSHLRQAGA